jgi:hypothetical protein
MDGFGYTIIYYACGWLNLKRLLNYWFYLRVEISKACTAQFSVQVAIVLDFPSKRIKSVRAAASRSTIIQATVGEFENINFACVTMALFFFGWGSVNNLGVMTGTVTNLPSGTQILYILRDALVDLEVTACISGAVLDTTLILACAVQVDWVVGQHAGLCLRWSLIIKQIWAQVPTWW